MPRASPPTGNIYAAIQFSYQTPETSLDAKALFAKSQSIYGFHPTLHRVMAEASAEYEAYLWLMDQFQQKTSFDPLEQQIVFTTTNYENHCRTRTLAGYTHPISKSLRLQRPRSASC